MLQTILQKQGLCSANQWTGFYMITRTAMKELRDMIKQVSDHNKIWSEDSLAILGYDDLKSLK